MFQLAVLSEHGNLVQAVKGQHLSEGAGVKICRTLGTASLRNLDPFLMLDELKCPSHEAAAGFPDHPHRGFETCSIMITGAMEHKDSQGNQARPCTAHPAAATPLQRSATARLRRTRALAQPPPPPVLPVTSHQNCCAAAVPTPATFVHTPSSGARVQGIIRDGGVQWMTAGRGIVHSEMPRITQGDLWGFQLWINLPKKDKMIKPRYQDYQAGDIPTVANGQGCDVRVMAGEFMGTPGAATLLSVMHMKIRSRCYCESCPLVQYVCTLPAAWYVRGIGRPSLGRLSLECWLMQRAGLCRAH
jgi:Pirin